jgi:hypothetical protein
MFFRCHPARRQRVANRLQFRHHFKHLAQLLWADFRHHRAAPVADLMKQYQVLVPKVDANGNETSGILKPDVKVPLASYTGWNLRGAGHAAGEGCTSNGGAIPFP